MPCLTTKANYAQQRQRVPWSSLTWTFQDAVDFTRRLGVQYLWVDWLQESTQMCSVYQNAYVTLVAVHAKDGSEGLYSNARPLAPFPMPLVFAGTSHHLYAKAKPPSFHSWYLGQLPDRAPLFDRAWCFQERIVSPRVLFFTEDEVV